MSEGVRSTAGESTSSSLLARVKAQDAQAWDCLCRIYGPLVYRWARAAGLQSADAADIVQQVFQAVVTGIAAFRRDRPADSFRGWLWTITRNKLRDHFRRLAASPSAEGGSDSLLRLKQLPDAPVENADEDNAPGIDAVLFHRALQLIQTDFSENTWQAFWRSAVEGQPAADIAADLGMSVAAVYQAKSRVLKRLREELKDLTEEYPGS